MNLVSKNKAISRFTFSPPHTVDFQSKKVCFYPIIQRGLADVINSPKTTENVDWNRPIEVVIHLNPRTQKFGGVKMATFGKSAIPLFGGDNVNICAKQVYATKRKDVMNAAGKMVTLEQKVPVDRASQLKQLMDEINCLVWGQSLVSMTFQFVDDRISVLGEPPLKIPKMSFVQAGLAKEEGDGQVYLIEQLIDEKTEGLFRKYIHNAVAKPVIWGTHDDKDVVRADFLAFSQHLQYWKSSKLVFVSDYQGLFLLSTGSSLDSLILSTVLIPGRRRSSAHRSTDCNCLVCKGHLHMR